MDHASSGTVESRAPRVCMLAYTFYENDGRVRRYSESLVTAGTHVDAIVLRRGDEPPEASINGVNVLRIRRRVRNEAGKYRYLLRILAFFVASMLEVTRRHLRTPYDVIHVHSVPDFEVFAALVPKLLGARVILDIHDIVPELYAAKFSLGRETPAFKALLLAERLSTGFADHVIAANDLWLEKLIARSVQAHKCSVLLNYPDASIFHEGRRCDRRDGKFVLMYPGTLSEHQGLDIAVRAFAVAHEYVPSMEFQIYGEGPAARALDALIDELGLRDSVHLRGPLPLDEIASRMANADLGVVPKRDDAFGGEAFSTKILEFMALGVPLVVARTRIDRYYFDESLLRFFEPGNVDDLAAAMIEAHASRETTAVRARNAMAYVQRPDWSWNSRKAEYLRLVSALSTRPLAI